MNSYVKRVRPALSFVDIGVALRNCPDASYCPRNPGTSIFWLIDRKRESLELLSDFLEALPDAEMHVVRNMYLGTEKKFELYNGSKMRATTELNGGRSLNFPEVADRVTDAGRGYGTPHLGQ